MDTGTGGKHFNDLMFVSYEIVVYDLLTVNAEISCAIKHFLIWKRGSDIIDICTVVYKSGVCKYIYSCAIYYKKMQYIHEVQCCHSACKICIYLVIYLFLVHDIQL